MDYNKIKKLDEESLQQLTEGFKSKREIVKRTSKCGKCGCDSEDIILRHSEANIKIVSPDVSTLCPCSSNCMPGKEKLQNNIKVTIERVQVEDRGFKSDTESTSHTSQE